MPFWLIIHSQRKKGVEILQLQLTVLEEVTCLLTPPPCYAFLNSPSEGNVPGDAGGCDGVVAALVAAPLLAVLRHKQLNSENQKIYQSWNPSTISHVCPDLGFWRKCKSGHTWENLDCQKLLRVSVSEMNIYLALMAFVLIATQPKNAESLFLNIYYAYRKSLLWPEIEGPTDWS